MYFMYVAAATYCFCTFVWKYIGERSWNETFIYTVEIYWITIDSRQLFQAD